MRYISRFLRGIDWVNDNFGKIICFLIVPMIGVLTYEVIMRYALNAPTNWGHEMTQHLFGGYAALVGAYALRHSAHVSVDVFYIHWSDRTKAIVNLFSWTLFWLFCTILVWRSAMGAWDSILRLDKTPTTWHPPLYPLKTALPVGAFLLWLQGLARYIRDFHMAVTGRKLE